MRPDHTHITVILDRSGSMDMIREDAIGGFNAFLEDQKKQPGTATLTLVQFDSQDPYEVVHQMTLLDDVPLLTAATFVPRGGTPLFDALGRAMADLEGSLAAMPEPERPELIVVAVITDGMENASHEFQRGQILKRIQDHEERDRWQFVFLSADRNALDEARDIGFQARSSRRFDANDRGTFRAFESFSGSLSEYRRLKKEFSFGP